MLRLNGGLLALLKQNGSQVFNKHVFLHFKGTKTPVTFEIHVEITENMIFPNKEN